MQLLQTTELKPGLLPSHLQSAVLLYQLSFIMMIYWSQQKNFFGNLTNPQSQIGFSIMSNIANVAIIGINGR